MKHITTSVSINSVDFSIAVGDTVGVRVLVSGYGSEKRRLIEADWFGGVVPPAESHTNGHDGKIWRHDGAVRIYRITMSRIFFK